MSSEKLNDKKTANAEKRKVESLMNLVESTLKSVCAEPKRQQKHGAQRKGIY